MLLRSIMLRLACAVAGVASLLHHCSVSLAASPQKTISVKITANDMCCNGCAQNVAAQLYAAPGVTLVQADVPSRVVTITASPSPKLTLERLWSAVEKGQGGPSQLVTSDAVYRFRKTAELKSEETLPAGVYIVFVEDTSDSKATQSIGQNMYSVPNVGKVSLDSARHAYVLRAKDGTALSIWALLAVVEQGGQKPMSIASPNGMLSVEKMAASNSRSASSFQSTGGVR